MTANLLPAELPRRRSHGKYPRRPKHVSETISASRCSPERACAPAHATSSTVGAIKASSRAVTSRRNRGYAVRSIDAIDPSPPDATAHHAADATRSATTPTKRDPQFAESESSQLMDFSALSWLYPK
jgi:hypothetical protein